MVRVFARGSVTFGAARRTVLGSVVQWIYLDSTVEVPMLSTQCRGLTN